MDEILARVNSEGHKANNETAELIIQMLEKADNYIPSSESVRREYRFVLLKIFREHLEYKEQSGGAVSLPKEVT